MLTVADRRISPRRLLMAAAVFHILVTLTVSIFGKAGLFPQTFNTDGIGISFAIDSVTYREHALQMANLLQRGKLSEWASSGPPSLSPFQLRLYSIFLAAFGPIVGYGILAVEPLNLAYYLLMLVFTYRIGRETFSDWVGLLAAMVIGLWPSLLMHTTQIMRDQLFICSFLLLMYCLLIGMRQKLSTRSAILSAVGAVVALCLILISKGNVWEVVLSALAVWALVCIVVQSRLRRWSWPRIILLTTIPLSALALPRVIPHFRVPDNVPATTRQPNSTIGNAPSTEQGRWSTVVTRVGTLRNRFIYRYGQSGSSVDTNVELNGMGDVVRYLPRAATIGFLAPFPRMWFIPGAYVGLTGRLVAGFEMIAVYVGLIFVAVSLFYERKRLSAWFLFLISALGCIALGYVVVNVAALYRMRYAYFMLLTILAARGFQIARNRLRKPED